MLNALSEFLHSNSIKGFLEHEEGCRLHALVMELKGELPVLEIGSYCGKSSIYLGDACRRSGNTLFSVDHHRGSEEHQLGEEYHDPDLYDKTLGRFNSFPAFQHTLHLAELNEHVVPLVSNSQTAVKHWKTPLGLVFVDGGHSLAQAMHDCSAWAEHIAIGGYLAVHDLFEDPAEGGQAPLIAFNSVFDSKGWVKLAQTKTLGVMRKVE